MYIFITKENRDTKYRIQCDLCGGRIDLDQDCEYLTPPADYVNGEIQLVHRHCDGQAFFRGYSSQITKPRHAIAKIADHELSAL